MMAVKSTYFFSFCVIVMMLFTSCEDLVEVSKPRSQLIRAAVFEDDLTAVAAVSELYTRMTTYNFLNVTYPASFSADELMIEGNSSGSQMQFYQNEISSINPVIQETWRYHYNLIYITNSILEGLERSGKLTPALKTQLKGEAKFFRAFHHFYLVNMFGDVPYINTTNYQVNGVVSRMPVADVYEKITTDLLEAKALLSADYSYSKNERVRVNKWAAAALLARVYLYREDWIHAEEQASTVINESSLYAVNNKLNEVFLKNSTETIWQLIPNYPQKYTQDGAWLNKPYYSLDNPRIPQELFTAFEPGDNRKDTWVGIGNDGVHIWYYPVKYKRTNLNTLGADEYSTVLRLAEQYLIRAEARAKQSNLIGSNSAASDLNIIRNRAGLQSTTAATQTELLLAIEQERRMELFTEWGHRWLDLKRTARATTVLSLVKPNWNKTDVLYPIPYSELQLNPKMTQNDGY